MKIAEIVAYPLRTKLETPFAFSQGFVHQRGSTLVEVRTDEGLVGWGEALCQGLQPPEIAAAAVEHALKPLLLGADPRDVEVLWHRMYHRVRDYGSKGAVVGAISGVDIALWDILGQSVGLPVYRLLGGAARDRVQVYATGFYRIEGRGEATRLAQEAETRLRDGFAAMKIKLGFGVDDDLRVMAEVARAIEGSGARLMIDTNHAYGLADALRLGQALEAHDLRWYEEPVAADDLAGYKALKAALRIPLAGGESEYTGFGFAQLARERAIDVAQPDIAAAGGFTGCRHIAAICHANFIQTNPHVWGSAISQIASLHLYAALPAAHHSLFAEEPVFEYDCSAHPFRNEIVAEPLAQKDGFLPMPKGPGLGLEVNRAALKRYVA